MVENPTEIGTGGGPFGAVGWDEFYTFGNSGNILTGAFHYFTP